MWQQWVNLVLATWLVLSNYLGLAATSMATNVTLIGIVMAILALWGALQHENMMGLHDRRQHRHGHA